MHTLPWRNRLGVKLAVAIVFASVVTMALFLFLMLRSQRRHLLDQALQSAAVVGDTINRSIEYDMLHDRRTEAYQIMDTVAAHEQIERLRVFDGAGRIRYSTDRSEIGHVPDMQAEACYPCHGSKESVLPLTITERTRISQRNGHRVLSAMTPIYNQASCSNAECHVHPASQRVIGVVELDLGLDPVESEMATLTRNTITLSILATLSLGAVAFLFTRRLVVRPVSRLLEDTRRIRAGDFNQRIVEPPQVEDELGVLQQSFNEMGQALATAISQRDELLQSLEHQVAERTAALEKAQQQLIQTEKLSSLGKLSASIAHEINNPLSGILTTAKLILRTFAGGELKEADRVSAVRQLQLVQRETERCTAIVRNLLGFARERPLAVTDADLNAALEEAVFLISNQVSLQNIRLERDLGPLPAIQADYGQLRQAFANILINACDAMPSGGVLRVRSRSLEADSTIEILVSDTGIGIPRDRLTKVLDPFFTTKEKGTGLGLSVVYGVVDRHGGTLAIESEPGIGTVVTIRLPVRQSSRDRGTTSEHKRDLPLVDR